MSKRLRSALESRANRLKLAVRKKPHGGVTVMRGVTLKYRRNVGPGSWVLVAADGSGGQWIKVIGAADDHIEADGARVLTFWQAVDKVRSVTSEDSAGERPITVAEALDNYQADLKARGGDGENVERIRYHLPA